jgi:hypothetical protein
MVFKEIDKIYTGVICVVFAMLLQKICVRDWRENPFCPFSGQKDCNRKPARQLP